MLKKTMLALSVAAIVTGQMAVADQTTPTMSPEIVTQDVMTDGANGGELVPFLALIFIILTMGGGTYRPT